MTHEPPAPPAENPQYATHYARSLGRMRRVSRIGLYTEPALVAAAKLLTDIETAGARHGITPDDWSFVTDLPGACLDVTSSHMRGVDRIAEYAAEQSYPSAQALAVHLVDVLHTELVDVHHVEATRTPHTYAVKFTVSGQRRAMRAGADGWQYDTDGAGLVDSVIAPYTDEGAKAVAAALAEVITGARPDPLTRQGTW